MRAALARLVFVGYKGVISPVIHAVWVSQCIFLPTCSEYAYTPWCVTAGSREPAWR